MLPTMGSVGSCASFVCSSEQLASVSLCVSSRKSPPAAEQPLRAAG